MALHLFIGPGKPGLFYTQQERANKSRFIILNCRWYLEDAIFPITGPAEVPIINDLIPLPGNGIDLETRLRVRPRNGKHFLYFFGYDQWEANWSLPLRTALEDCYGDEVEFVRDLDPPAFNLSSTRERNEIIEYWKREKEFRGPNFDPRNERYQRAVRAGYFQD